jgi:cephalosporin hydroxylase
MNPIKKFYQRNKKLIKRMNNDSLLKQLTKAWFLGIHKYEYERHFTWLGRPIIQFPQDIITFQEIIWNVKPDLIIETGIAHGGSLIFTASMLELLGNGEVLGIDIEIREHNKLEIKKHPLYKRITMIEGSSTDSEIFNQVCKLSKQRKKILVILDSDHSYDHVLKELRMYSSLVKKDSYIIVCDTNLSDFPKNWLKDLGIDRPWNSTNNPKNAVYDFLKENKSFQIDKTFQEKSLITTAPDGFLKCVKN